MKNAKLLIWLTQLGLSVAIPLGGFVLLAMWLRQRFDLGIWVLIAGIALGLICAADGLRNSLKAMSHMAEDPKKEPEESAPVYFNDHE